MSVLNRRVSKVRHVFDKPAKKGCTFDIKPTTQPWETKMSSVNEKFLAVAVESSGGGAFAVLPVDKVLLLFMIIITLVKRDYHL